MARVTDNEVCAVVDTKRDVSPFIETANLIVEEQLVSAGMTPARLKQIELYLSAHFVAITEERGGLTSTGTGASKETYFGLLGEGLKATRYGQQVISLDTSGILVLESGGKSQAEFRVV